MRLLPRHFPFLLISHILSFRRNHFLHTMGGISIGRPFFRNRFPKGPVFPNILVLRTVTRTANVLTFGDMKGLRPNRLCCFTNVSRTHFGHPIIPNSRVVVRIAFRGAHHNLAHFGKITLISNGMIYRTAVVYTHDQRT